MKIESNSSEFRKNLHELWQSDKHCDVFLVAGDGETRIAAHRLVLEAASPYFATQTAGATENLRELFVAEIDGSTLEQLVAACYSGSLEVNESNMSSVYMGAIHLQLNVLLTALENYIMTQLNSSNCLHFHKLAETFSRSVLFEATKKFICRNFVEISGRPSFLELDVIYLNKLLTLNELKVPSAEDLFHKVILWMKHDPNGQRDEFLIKLLPNLRLLLMSPLFLLEHVKPHCRTIEATDLVFEALEKYLKSVSLVPANVGRSLAPVNVGCERLLIVAGSVANREYQIMEYLFEQQVWKVLANLPIKEEVFTINHSVAFNSLCFVSALSGTAKASELHLWNLATHEFTYLTNTMRTRYATGIVSLNDDSDANGDLIVVGGWQKERPVSMVERWSRKLGKWHPVHCLKEGRDGATLFLLGNLIYCIGGQNTGYVLPIECYDLSKKCWSTLAPLHHGRFNCAVVNEGEKLYVMGGESNVIECYDPIKNIWTEVCTIKGSAVVESCVRYKNRLFAFGWKTVLTSHGDWKVWQKNNNMAIPNKHIYRAF